MNGENVARLRTYRNEAMPGKLLVRVPPEDLDAVLDFVDQLRAERQAILYACDESTLGLARNIVSQLFDAAHVPVRVRQAINDECDAFVARVLADYAHAFGATSGDAA